MNDGIHGMAREHVAQTIRIGEAAVLDRSPLHCPSVALAQVVEDDRRMARFGQEFCRVAADVAGTAGHEYAHGVIMD